MAKKKYLEYFRFKRIHCLWYVYWKSDPDNMQPTGKSVDEYTEADIVNWAYEQFKSELC